MKRHKHSEIIKAWAEGADVEVGTYGGWTKVEKTHCWSEDYEYRLKPAEPVRAYPETGMRDDELNKFYTPCGRYVRDFRNVANAALRHAIDSHQVVPAAWFDEVLRERDALVTKRGEHDMAIALAVRDATIHSCHPQGRMVEVQRAMNGDVLNTIIAKVQA